MSNNIWSDLLLKSTNFYNCYVEGNRKSVKLLAIKKVIFNPPATIIIWDDGTKTVVKASGEDFDEEKGFAMAVLKKMFGSRNKYLKIIKNAKRGCRD